MSASEGNGPGVPPGRSAPAGTPRGPAAQPGPSPAGVVANVAAQAVVAGVEAGVDAAKAAAAPFTSAPPPGEGTFGHVTRVVGGVVALAGAPAMIIDSAFAAFTAPLAAMFPSFPAVTLLGMHVAPPHGHMHPPSLIPPSPVPVPLPSLGMLMGAGSVTVLIGGMPAARAGDIGISVTCGSLAPPFEVYTGSSNVFIGGARAARVMDITKHCNPEVSEVSAMAAAMGAAGAVVGAAGAIAASHPWAAIQAAADAATLALKMLMGKDPGIPPGFGMLVGPPVPTVLIGGFPCPPVGTMAAAGLMKLLKKAVKALRGGSAESNGCSGNSGHPIYVVTGENFDQFVDFVSGGLFEWHRHYTTARSGDDGPLGHGWRHFYQRSLRVRLHRATFTDWNGVAIDFPRFEYGSDTTRAEGRVLRRLTEGHYRLSHGAKPDLEFAGNPFAEDLRLVRVSSKDRDLTFGYDERGRLVAVVEGEVASARKRRFELRYDGASHVTDVVELVSGGADGSRLQPILRARYAYAAGGDLARAYDALGGAWSYECDGFHRLTKQTDARGYSFSYRYDAQGRCVQTSGDDGLWAAEIEYFPEKKVSRFTEGHGAKWEVRYDGDGVITAVVDPYGATKLRERDEEGKLAREVDSGGRVLGWLYDADGAHYGRRDRFGNVFPPEVDMPTLPNPFERKLPDTSFGWLLESGGDIAADATLGANESVFWALPPDVAAQARLCFLVRPRERTGALPETRIEHDALGRKTREIDPFGRARDWQYDATGNVIAERDRDGRVTTRTTTSWNLVGEWRDPLGNATRYRYSNLEQVVGLVDPLGSETRYDYDLKERLERVHRHGRLRDVYVYDEGDHFIEKRDGAGNVIFQNEIHENHFVKVRKLASGGEHRFDYDFRGRVTEASTADCKVAIAYDVQGRRVRDLRDGVGIEVEHGREASYRATFMKRFVATAERFSSETRLVNSAGKETRLTVREDGMVTRVCGNGTTELLQYDSDGRLRARLTYGVYGREDRARPPRWSAAYAYTPEGDLVQRDDSLRGTTRFEVDEAHRLVAEVAPRDERHEYPQDGASNVRLKWLEIERGNRLARAADESFEYDDRDRLALRRRADGSSDRYVYDSFDMLVRVERVGRGGVGTTTWEASYDGTGRRLSVRDGESVREFYWDGDRLAAEVSPSGHLRIYQYATRDALVPLGFVEYDGRDAEPESGRTYHVFSDPVGMPLHIEDDHGRIVWWAERVHPFGAVTVRAGASVEYNLRWPGHYFDAETGLQYNRYRYYAPDLGRYLQGDPIGYKGSPVNLYAYCANPLVQVDLLGLEHEERAGKTAEEGEGPQGKEEPPEPSADPNVDAQAKDGPPARKELLELSLKEMRQKKPKHAPDVNKWLSNNGKVDFYSDGTVVYTRGDGAKLPYRNDYPVFREGTRANGEPMVIADVSVKQAGNYTSDFKDANVAAGDPPCKPSQNGHPDGTVWHHHEDGQSMQLIRDEDHTASSGGFPHQGGVSKLSRSSL